MELNWLEQPSTQNESYKEKVLLSSPLVYWPLDETSGTTVDNAQGTASYDGSSVAVQYTRSFFNVNAYSFGSTRVNIYSAGLNTNMNKAEGTISLWFRIITKEDWTPLVTKRLLNIAADDNNRFLIQVGTGSTLDVFRIASGTVKTVSHSYSSKPLEWQNIIITYSITGNAFKLFVNGTQSGSTQTSLGTFSGALDSAKVIIGAQDTSNTLPSTNTVISNVAIWNRVLTTTEITFLSTPPNYTETITLTHSILASWDIFALIGVAGSTMACFAEDVDSDGQKEFVGNIGRRMRFVAIKQNGTILWDTTVSATQAEGLRFPQYRNGVMYYGSLNRACAIRCSDGVVLWDKNPIPGISSPASGLGGMNQSSVGLVVGIGNKLDILNYSTGVSIGGNFPVTLPFQQWEQSLGVGIFGTSTEVIISNDNFNNMIVYNINGTIRFQKGPLVGTVNWVNENDWYEFSDIQNTGNKVLVLVADDDATSTQPALEGDELHIYGPTGTQLDKYDDGIHTGGLQFHTYAWPNGGRVVFTHESDYTNKRLTMLDHNLNEVWTKNVGTPYEGDQCILLDVNGDGHPEILYSTEVFSETGGFRVLNWLDGSPCRFFTSDNPTVADDIVDSKGAAVNIFVSRAPYVWEPDKFIQFTHRTTDSTGHEIIYLHKWTP